MGKMKEIYVKFLLKINHIVFWWYYKRVPLFFHKWTILESIVLLKQNYEHALTREEGLNRVIKVKYGEMYTQKLKFEASLNNTIIKDK